MTPFLRRRIIVGTIVVAVLGIALLYVHFKNEKPAITPIVVITPSPRHTVIGSSVEGRTIDAYTYGTGTTSLVFVGGIHGGYEWNSVLLAYTFMDYLEAHPEIIPKSIAVTVIPSANPDGVYKVIGKEGRFTTTDVPAGVPQEPGRFNAHTVDLNRNFDCKWQPTSTWKNKIVSAGSAEFSEPETQAIRDFALANKPAAVVFWHSQANSVFASQCEKGILPTTLAIMNAYASAASYPAAKTFDAYATTGAADDWLATINIPAITVELKTHETIEWEKNLAGIKALFEYFSPASPL